MFGNNNTENMERLLKTMISKQDKIISMLENFESVKNIDFNIEKLDIKEVSTGGTLILALDKELLKEGLEAKGEIERQNAQRINRLRDR